MPLEQFEGIAVEGELAIRLAHDLSGELTQSAARDAIESVFTVIELHNLVFRGNQPTAEELVANNAIHAGFVCAAERHGTFETSPGELRITINDEVVATVEGDELMRTIVDSLVWLSDELARRSMKLQAGQTILCGSVADLFPLPSGGHIQVSTDHFGSVECSVK